MSRVKSPREKKRLSLDRDRRNVFRENDKASRKNVPRAKQRSQMKIRRSVNQALAKVRGEIDESVALEADALARVRLKLLRQRAFEKMPDQPLRTVIGKQKYRQVCKAISAALRKAKIPERGGVVCVAVDGFEVYVHQRDAKRTHDIVAEALQELQAIRPSPEYMERKYNPFRKP
jgi:hypothetical protein